MRTRNTTRIALAVPALAAALALGACGSDDDDATATTAAPAATTGATASTVSATIKTFQFTPNPLTVPAGATIEFLNQDKIDHTVTAGTPEAPTPEVFDGMLPMQGATVQFSIAEPGTYDYFCRIHPSMTGEIIVE